MKLSSDFMKTVPRTPGVYEFLDAAGVVIYVGKAKILRRRLSQYRNARRCKKHHKMRAILSEAVQLRVQPCTSDLDALLLENRLIQELRPRFNIAGAFSFLYPVIGLKREIRRLCVVYTTSPDIYPDFNLRGSYRSRELTREAYFALIDLLTYLGHREPQKDMSVYPKAPFSHVSGFRQIEDRWHEPLVEFLEGRSVRFLQEAVARLLEKPLARRRAEEIQGNLNAMMRFYKFEARPLRHALEKAGVVDTFLPQKERDRVFLISR